MAHDVLSDSSASVRARLALFDDFGLGIAEVDHSGLMVRVNAQLCDLVGRPADELIGRTIFDETFPDDVARDREQFEQQVVGKIDRYSVDKRILRGDGTSFWVSVTSTSVRDPTGRFLYAVRLQQDISGRKQAQQELLLRAQEQETVHRFTNRLQQVRSLGDIYEPALDAIQEALRCQRASILLVEDRATMTFVAWRGVSDAYRRAVEGHSPWDADEENPQPVCYGDIQKADLPDFLKAAGLNEGIKGLAFIPVVASGRLLGKFMAYHDQPHTYTDAEIDVAVTLAHQLGFGIERIRAQKAAQQLISIVESSHDAIVSKNLDGIISTWN